MPKFDRQNRFVLTIPNAEPAFRVFDGPGEYPLPDEPEWLQAPAPSRHREPILVSNAHRYLLDNHYDVLLLFPHFALPAAWDLRPNETPHMHFERVSQMAKLWQGEGVL